MKKDKWTYQSTKGPKQARSPWCASCSSNIVTIPSIRPIGLSLAPSLCRLRALSNPRTVTLPLFSLLWRSFVRTKSQNLAVQAWKNYPLQLMWWGRPWRRHWHSSSAKSPGTDSNLRKCRLFRHCIPILSHAASKINDWAFKRISFAWYRVLCWATCTRWRSVALPCSWSDLQRSMNKEDQSWALQSLDWRSARPETCLQTVLKYVNTFYGVRLVVFVYPTNFVKRPTGK